MRPPSLTGAVTAYRTESRTISNGRITPESDRLPASTISGLTAGVPWDALSVSESRRTPPVLTSSTSAIC